MLTESIADDTSQLPALLEAAKGKIASVTADGAYGGEPAYQAVASHQPDPLPDIVIPQRASAVTRAENVEVQSQRDRHIQHITENGHMAWQKATGHGRRSLVETRVGRHKAIIGPKLSARMLPARQSEVAMGAQLLNRMI